VVICFASLLQADIPTPGSKVLLVKNKSKYERESCITAAITSVFLDLISPVCVQSCVFSMQYTEKLENVNFIPCSFHTWCLIFKNSFFFFSCYFCSLSVPLLLLYILKGLRQDIILLHFYGGNHAKPWFTQGTIMLLESLVKIKTTRPQVLKKVTNIALVPFCIHHEHTDACPEGHSGAGRDNDAQKLLSFLVSQMHRKLSRCCLYVLLKRCSVQSIAEHQYSTCETAYI